MGEDIFEQEKKIKTPISLTLDDDLINELEEYKKNKGIKSLSPMVNKMLKDWLKKEKEKRNEI